jgi:hypothetical protein
LQQGKIKHIDFRIRADFEAHTLKIEADYQLAEPVSGSLFLDTAGIDLQKATSDGQTLQWEFGQQDEILGERLHLKNLNGVSSFTLVSTRPTRRAPCSGCRLSRRLAGNTRSCTASVRPSTRAAYFPARIRPQCASPSTQRWKFQKR